MASSKYVKRYFGTVTIDPDKLLDVCDTVSIVPKVDACKDVDVTDYPRKRTIISMYSDKQRKEVEEFRRLDAIVQDSVFVSKKYGFTYAVFFRTPEQIYLCVQLFTDEFCDELSGPMPLSDRPDFSHIREAFMEDTVQFKTGDFITMVVN